MEPVELRAAGKLHGRLYPETMTLEVKTRWGVFHYDLLACAQQRRTVVERLLAADEDEHLTTPSPLLNGD